MIGRQLKGRYEILVKIGEGGMANVYSARDNLLNRTVTVKILKDFLVNDQDFVRRFRREAQAAACLSHPQVINIYDVGEEDDVHYIVMEYVQGKTLKDIIREKGRLPAEEAIEIFRLITEAIHNAHQNKVIHRDIKPQNILISRSGQVKVTDFGIALAVSTGTVTYDEQQILGSVHYFSPEQAKGAFTGEQSDVYSLGILLYEMLTGQVPFEGDSPISVALKHLNEDIKNPRSLYSDIPEALEKMVLKAVKKKPSHRYAGTAEMLEDIHLWQNENRVKAALREEKESDNYEDEDIENTNKMEPIKNGNGFEREIKNEKKPFWRKKAFVITLGLLFFIGFIVGGYNLLIAMLAVPDVEVPNVEGLLLQEAVEELKKAELDYSTTFSFHEEVPEEHVISQNPPANSLVKVEREILLEVSRGRQSISVPDVSNLPQREASLILQQIDVDFHLEDEFNEEVQVGYVIRQDPRPGVQVFAGDEVILYISKGVRSFPIRNLVGETEINTRLYLDRQGLIIDGEKNEYSQRPEGTVIEQYPPAGTEVRAGDLVDIVWSMGPEPEPEPDPEPDPQPDPGPGDENGEEDGEVNGSGQ